MPKHSDTDSEMIKDCKDCTHYEKDTLLCSRPETIVSGVKTYAHLCRQTSQHGGYNSWYDPTQCNCTGEYFEQEETPEYLEKERLRLLSVIEKAIADLDILYKKLAEL